MSMFICAACEQLRDSDSGCEEYHHTQLICQQCVDERDEDGDEPDSWAKFDSATQALKKARADFEEAMSPRKDPLHPMFANHNCAYCGSGEKPCKRGNPSQCEFPHARND